MSSLHTSVSRGTASFGSALILRRCCSELRIGTPGRVRASCVSDGSVDVDAEGVRDDAGRHLLDELVDPCLLGLPDLDPVAGEM